MVIQKEEEQECMIYMKYNKEEGFIKSRVNSFVKWNTKVREYEELK